ncbi:hypothetical protein QZH41_017879, partial [Actinostola sp. cb2023]
MLLLVVVVVVLMLLLVVVLEVLLLVVVVVVVLLFVDVVVVVVGGGGGVVVGGGSGSGGVVVFGQEPMLLVGVGGDVVGVGVGVVGVGVGVFVGVVGAGGDVVGVGQEPMLLDSKNCKKELNYADAQDVPIVPVMCEQGFKAKGWLGVVTAGLLWINFRDPSNFNGSAESLAKEVMHAAELDIKLSQSEKKKAEEAAPPQAPRITVEKKPGRAFRHKLAGKFLAESGEICEVKFHQASGNRSTLVLREEAEDTSYWVEEKQKKSEIVYYKNYATNGYLGFDPNGNYLYTKGQHYGAEEWLLMTDEKSQS